MKTDDLMPLPFFGSTRQMCRRSAIAPKDQRNRCPHL